MRVLTCLALAAALCLTSGCSSDDPFTNTDTRTTPWWSCPPVVSNATGLDHGKKCASSAECKYGQCVFGSFIVGYDATKGLCTKNSNCAAKVDGNGATVPCAVDNTATAVYYTTIEKTVGGGNTDRTNPEPHKICTVGCKSDKECVAWNPDTPHCIKTSTKHVSVGTSGACGFDIFKS